MWREADFVGGHPALDFVNTVADSGKTRTEEKLQSWSAMRLWVIHSKLMTEDDIRRFDQAGRFEDPATLADLIDLREAAYRALAARETRGHMDLPEMRPLQDRMHAALHRSELEPANERFRWRADATSRHRWTDTVALAFEDLLRSEDLKRVRQCQRCTWFFIDRGRGRGRRWCDMRTCGNRAKAQAFRTSHSNEA